MITAAGTGRGTRAGREYIVTNDEILAVVEAWRGADCPKKKRRLGGEVVSSLGFLIQSRLKPHRGAAFYDDLFQEGRLGVMRALEDFDPERGKNFFKFAKWHIQTRIRRYLLREMRRKETPVAEPRPADDMIAEGADDRMERLEGQHVLMGALDFLPDKDRRVIFMRFGLDGSGPQTCQQVGQQLGISRQRVQQIESKALKSLRRNSSIRRFFCET
jgi:RNA polymerase sigma factor (sigma-70 family)